VDNSYEAYASSPRYSPIGLEGEIEREELEQARKIDAQAAASTELSNISAPSEPVLGGASKEAPEDINAKPDPQQDMRSIHEKIVGVVDVASRVPRDIAGGLYKATENTLSLVVGRENHDKANEWLRENLPGLTSFTDSFEKGISPEGVASEITQEMTQFMAPFSLYMKGIGAMSSASGVKTGMFTEALLADIITSGTALDPHMERFSSMVKQMGVDNQIIGWLADNENETDSEGRLKNIIENAGLGVGIAGAFAASAMTMKGMWRLSKTPKKPTAAATKNTLEVLAEAKAVAKREADMSHRVLTGKPPKIEAADNILGTHDIAKEVEQLRKTLPRDNLNKKLMIDEKVMVDGVEETIQRPAGDMLKDMDNLVKSLEDVLREL